MKSLLDFMYKGEVNVGQNMLPMFLKTAESLQVRGLTENNALNTKVEERSTPQHTSIPTPENLSSRGEPAPPVYTPPHAEKRRRKNSAVMLSSRDDMPTDLMTTTLRHYESQGNQFKAVKSCGGGAQSDDSSTPPPPPPAHAPPPRAPPLSASQHQVKMEPDQKPYHHQPMPVDASSPAHHVPGVAEMASLLGQHALSDSSETESMMQTHIDPTDTIDAKSGGFDGTMLAGSKGWHMRLTFERVAGALNLHRCKLCGKVVTHIRNHYHVHFPGRFECPLCRATYTRSDNLRTHCKFKHPAYNPDTRKFDNAPAAPPQPLFPNHLDANAFD